MSQTTTATSTNKIKLTDARVAALPIPESSPVFVWDTDVRGFGVKITPTGTKSWIAQAKVNRKTRRVTLGRCDRLPIRCAGDDGKEIGARHRAKQKLLEMADGVDPREAQRLKGAKGLTLSDAVDEYLLNKRTKNGPLRPSTKKDIQRCVDGVFSEWADIPIADITRSMCQKKFHEISKTAPVQANRDFRYLSAVINRVRENATTEDGQYTILPVNPVAQLFRKNGLEKWNPVGKRKTKIPKDKIGAVFNLLEGLADHSENIETTCTSADLVLFLLLTGCRIGESRTLTWDRVDLESKVPTFHLPGDIVKNHNGMTLPISKPLLAVLRRRLQVRRKNNNHVFPAVTGNAAHISDPRNVFKKVSGIAGENISPHPLRRTFEFIALTTGVDSDQRRLLLNHVSGDVHSVHYSNADEPATLLPAVEMVGQWVVEQARLASAEGVV